MALIIAVQPTRERVLHRVAQLHVLICLDRFYAYSSATVPEAPEYVLGALHVAQSHESKPVSQGHSRRCHRLPYSTSVLPSPSMYLGFEAYALRWTRRMGNYS